MSNRSPSLAEGFALQPGKPSIRKSRWAEAMQIAAASSQAGTATSPFPGTASRMASAKQSLAVIGNETARWRRVPS